MGGDRVQTAVFCFPGKLSSARALSTPALCAFFAPDRPQIWVKLRHPVIEQPWTCERDIQRYVARGPWSAPLDDGRFRCDLCPRRCQLRPGQRGFCYVREADEHGVKLTSYGRASGFCIDPIEKKPLNHFYPGTSVLSFGTAGCNLGCRFCQNWDISKARADDKLQDFASPQAIVEAAKAADCHSIAFTYNDPVIFAEYAIDTAIAAREAGIQNVAVTAGYITESARADFFRYLDAANIDLKAFSEEFYRRQCYAELQPVLETLVWLKRETNVWFEVTTLLIPGLNDSESEVGKLCEWFADNLGQDVPLHFTAFHPDFKLDDRPRTPKQTLERARSQATAAGLRFVYTGNVHDAQGQTSYCSSCGGVLIERDWYTLGAYNVSANADGAGSCARCGTPVAGRFAGHPGSWGPRRRRLKLVKPSNQATRGDS